MISSALLFFSCTPFGAGEIGLMGARRILLVGIVLLSLCAPGCALKETFNCLDTHCFFPDWTNCNCCDSECWREDGYNFHWVCPCSSPCPEGK
jgi:hypothetical protein